MCPGPPGAPGALRVRTGEDALSAAHLIAGEGTIYPLLARLRRDGLVETVWRESAAGPPRRYYVLTPAGAEALDQFRRQWAQFTVAVNHFMEEHEEASTE